MRRLLCIAWAVLAVGAADGPRVSAQTTPAAAPLPPHLQRGRMLAQIHCQVCHLFPEPDLLDKRTWANGTLRRMAPLLGVARMNFDAQPDGAMLRDSNLFPKTPILSEPDWRAIVSYYLETAPDEALPQQRRDPILRGPGPFRVEPVVEPGVAPAVTLVAIEPSARRLLLGDARNKALHVLDPQGRRKTSVTVDSAPVAITHDGPDTYLTLIGHVFPSDEKAGQVVRWNDGPAGGGVRPVLTGLKRPVDCLVTDLNQDGRKDLVVAQFGNYLGRLSWFENRAGTGYVDHPLLESPGALRSVVVATERDRPPALLVLLAQAREGLYLVQNRGSTGYVAEPRIQFPPVYGSTGFELADFNGDGFPDVLTVNGDNGEYPSPFKRYHGLRIFLNDGHHHFREAWFFPLNGAFKALARDFDGDGDLDLAAISFFPDYGRSPEESFVYLENKGGLNFEASSPPEATMGRWLSMDAGDLDGDGRIDLVLGSFVDGPRATPIPPALERAWATNGVSAIILRNIGTTPEAR